MNEIHPINSNSEFHGYQEWYSDNKLWIRGNQKNGQHVGYRERHRTHPFTDLLSNLKEYTKFYIR